MEAQVGFDHGDGRDAEGSLLKPGKGGIAVKHNLSNIDRGIRAVLGAALIAGGVVVGGITGIVLYAVAAILLGTAAVGFCPLYKLLGIDTCKLSKSCQP